VSALSQSAPTASKMTLASKVSKMTQNNQVDNKLCINCFSKQKRHLQWYLTMLMKYIAISDIFSISHYKILFSCHFDGVLSFIGLKIYKEQWGSSKWLTYLKKLLIDSWKVNCAKLCEKVLERIISDFVVVGRSHSNNKWHSRAVFFNLGSADPRGSANSLLGSLRILKLAPIWVFRFRKCSITFQKFQDLKKVEKYCSKGSTKS